MEDETGLTVAEQAELARMVAKKRLRAERAAFLACDSLPKVVQCLTRELEEEGVSELPNYAAVREDGKVLVQIARLGELEPEPPAPAENHLHLHISEDEWARKVAAAIEAAHGVHPLPPDSPPDDEPG